MRTQARRIALVAVALSVMLPAAAVAEGAAYLFDSHEPLDIRIEGPIATLMRDRPDDIDLSGTASWRDADGRNVEVAVGLRTRGNYRRQSDTCPFPPIRLNFKQSDVKNTLFHKQDKLKLVSHCRDNSTKAEQVLLREYLTYRLFNALTDFSYRVRLLNVTYVDTGSGGRERSAHAFAIEHKDRLSKRIGLPLLEVPRLDAEALDPAKTNLVSLFEYLIGNTDFSTIAGAADRNCCHNITLFGGDASPAVPIPYDFDMSGMVSAPYGGHNPRFKLRSVRQRLYRGRCAFNAHLPDSIAAFTAIKAALYALVENEDTLSKSSRKSMRTYLNSFYKIIETPKQVERRLVKACV